MTVFRAQIFFEKGSLGKWSNVYHIDADSLLDAKAEVINTMIEHLRTMLNTTCILSKVLVSSLTTDEFSEQVINEDGIDTGGGSLLPLFNCAKVFIQTAGLGRPDYKFIKGFLVEDYQDDGTINSDKVTFLDAEMTEMIANMTTVGVPLVSENGQLWGAVSVQQSVQMRQMHRKRKKTTPAPA